MTLIRVPGRRLNSTCKNVYNWAVLELQDMTEGQ